MITRNKFNERYASKGGIGVLESMIAGCRRRRDISEYFGVSEDRVRQWCDDMGLERPNYHKCMTIKEMLEVSKESGMDEVERRFKDSVWYEKGLEAIKKKHV